MKNWYLSRNSFLLVWMWHLQTRDVYQSHEIYPWSRERGMLHTNESLIFQLSKRQGCDRRDRWRFARFVDRSSTIRCKAGRTKDLKLPCSLSLSLSPSIPFPSSPIFLVRSARPRGSEVNGTTAPWSVLLASCKRVCWPWNQWKYFMDGGRGTHAYTLANTLTRMYHFAQSSICIRIYATAGFFRDHRRGGAPRTGPLSALSGENRRVADPYGLAGPDEKDERDAFLRSPRARPGSLLSRVSNSGITHVWSRRDCSRNAGEMCAASRDTSLRYKVAPERRRTIT